MKTNKQEKLKGLQNIGFRFPALENFCDICKKNKPFYSVHGTKPKKYYCEKCNLEGKAEELKQESRDNYKKEVIKKEDDKQQIQNS